MVADYNRATCKELKAILLQRSQPIKGLKSVLVQRVVDSEPAPVDHEDDEPALKYILAGVNIHRHSGMGRGRYYSSSDVRAMWQGKPQISTGVQIVQEATEAGGTTNSASMGGSKKALIAMCTSNRPGARKARGTSSEMKSARLTAEHVAREEKNNKIKSLSKGFWCTKHKKCNRWFATKAGLEAHMRRSLSLYFFVAPQRGYCHSHTTHLPMYLFVAPQRGYCHSNTHLNVLDCMCRDECQSGTQMFRKSSTEVSVDRNIHRSDYIKRVVAGLAGCVTSSSTQVETPAVLAVDLTFDGVFRDLPGGPYTVPATAKGFAARVYRNAVVLTWKQREYLEWCFKLGESDKSLKISPRTAAKRMPLHGTTAGWAMYSASRFQNYRPEFWRDRGVPTFRVSQCLDHWYIKTWFSSRKQRGDPNEFESVMYQGEHVWTLRVTRLREIATVLGIQNGNKSELRRRISERVRRGLSVGKKVKCVVSGEDVMGVIVDEYESADRAGHTIYRVRYVNNSERNMHLDEFTFL